jgi:hypothetical protein
LGMLTGREGVRTTAIEVITSSKRIECSNRPASDGYADISRRSVNCWGSDFGNSRVQLPRQQISDGACICPGVNPHGQNKCRAFHIFQRLWNYLKELHCHGHLHMNWNWVMVGKHVLKECIHQCLHCWIHGDGID